MSATRPDIMHVVCLAARFSQELKASLVMEVKTDFKGTKEFGLMYPKGSDFTLKTYVDWVGCLDNQWSTSGEA